MWRRGKSRRSARDYKVKLNLKKSKTFHQLSLLFKIQIGGGDLEYKGVSVWGPPCSHTTHTFFLLTKGDPKRQKVCSDTENQNSFLSFFLYIILLFLSRTHLQIGMSEVRTPAPAYNDACLGQMNYTIYFTFN